MTLGGDVQGEAHVVKSLAEFLEDRGQRVLARDGRIILPVLRVLFPAASSALSTRPTAASICAIATSSAASSPAASGPAGR